MKLLILFPLLFSFQFQQLDRRMSQARKAEQLKALAEERANLLRCLATEKAPAKAICRRRIGKKWLLATNMAAGRSLLALERS